MTMLFVLLQNRSQINEQAALQAQAAEALTQIGFGEEVAANLAARLETVEELTKLIDSIKSALAESIQQVLDSAAENITAAELNTGEAGTVKRSFTVQLQTLGGAGLLHEWANLEPSITPAVSTSGVAGAPTLNGTPFYSGGKMTVFFTFDTDAGSSITYSGGDNVTFPVIVSGFPVLAGVANVTKTYNVT